MSKPAMQMLNEELRTRATALNSNAINPDARYVLVWLQQTLRGADHPAIDAGVQIGNELGIPVLVYHGLREDYPHASDRLHTFILGASREMARTLAQRQIACIQHVVRPSRVIKGLVYKLADEAACVVTDHHATFVASTQARRFAAKTSRFVLAVDATRLVPQALLPSGLTATKAFRAAHTPLREQCLATRIQIEPSVPPYEGPLPFEPDALAGMDDHAIAALVAQCRIDHSLPPSLEHPATADEVNRRIETLVHTTIARYKWGRNNPADGAAGSQLSPYLHFGMTSPFAILRALDRAEIAKPVRYKFVDELLTWREWCHWRMTVRPELTSYAALPNAARATMEAHSHDPRDLLSLSDLAHGNSPDETWNAAQRQWLSTGWMHNNLRMYWAKQILKWTPDPQTAWASACYLNDRLSIDGRDSATYVMMRWAFGEARPAYREQPIYGWISPKTDTALRKRPGAKVWLADMAARPVAPIQMPQSDTWKAAYLEPATPGNADSLSP